MHRGQLRHQLVITFGDENGGSAGPQRTGTSAPVMNTYLPDAAHTTDAVVRTAAVEQVMRCCDDDLAVLQFVDLVPLTPQAAAALGKLTHAYPMRLVAGCPLMALVTGGPLDRHWRDSYPARPDSLYANLEFLAAMFGGLDPDEDPYGALTRLRERAEAELGDLQL